MTNSALSTNNSETLLDQLVTAVVGIETDNLESLRIAIARNIVERNDPCEVAVERACAWFERVQPDTFIGDIPEKLKDFLEWLRPVDAKWLMTWAQASMRCISDELGGYDRSKALRWLNEQLVGDFGAAAATTCIAEFLMPNEEQPLRPWAERTFRSIMKIENPNEKGLALSWLEERIATRIGKQDATNAIADWMHEAQQPNDVRDTERCAPPAPSETDVRELTAAPATPATAEVAAKPKKKAKKNRLGAVDQKISGLNKEIRRHEAALRDGTGGDADELSSLKGQLELAVIERDRILAKIAARKQQQAA